MLHILNDVGIAVAQDGTMVIGLRDDGQDMVARRRALARRLGGATGADARSAFLDGLRAFSADEAALRALLQPLRASASLVGGESSGAGASVLADSLARVLLGVDDLQTDVLTLLLERLCDHFVSVADGATGISADRLPRQILHQLRWLDHLVEPTKVVSRLTELLGIAPPDVQREIILALPEIVGDAEHKVTGGRKRFRQGAAARARPPRLPRH